MMGADSEVLFPCPRCGAEGQLRVCQSVLREELRWYEYVNCSRCGLRTESDGLGFPPAGIREGIIAANGHWKLVLTNVRSIPAVAKVFREHLDLGAKEVLAVLQVQNDEGIYKGTNAEALWLSNLLQKVGEVPHISRLD